MCSKNTKFRSDMWSNTKMKIINTLKERDLIFYVWFRIVNLATVADDGGFLYITENMPYTVTTLSIEFDRSEEDIALALNVLIKLQMIEYLDEEVFKVKNWTRYQLGEKAVQKENMADSEIKCETQKEAESSLNNHSDSLKKLDRMLKVNKPIVQAFEPKVEIRPVENNVSLHTDSCVNDYKKCSNDESDADISINEDSRTKECDIVLKDTETATLRKTEETIKENKVLDNNKVLSSKKIKNDKVLEKKKSLKGSKKKNIDSALKCNTEVKKVEIGGGFCDKPPEGEILQEYTF